MIKNFIKTIVLVAVFVVISAISGFASQDAPVSVYVDGKKVSFDVEPVIENGRTLVPMRAIFEALGADVGWTYETKTATASKDDVTVSIAAGSTKMLKNGESIVLDVGAKILDSRMLVPARAVSEGLDAAVEWHASDRRVAIMSKGALSFKTLSDADRQSLSAQLGDIRRDFEQNILYNAIYESRRQYASDVKGGNITTSRYITDLWDGIIAKKIFDIQSSSDTLYVVNEYETLSDLQIKALYNSIAKSVGISSADVLTATLSKTPSENAAVLVTFKEAQAQEDCKYIAVVADTETVRYFTAEISESGKRTCKVCEINLGGKKSSGIEVAGDDAFLAAVDSLMAK